MRVMPLDNHYVNALSFQRYSMEVFLKTFEYKTKLLLENVEFLPLEGFSYFFLNLF